MTAGVALSARVRRTFFPLSSEPVKMTLSGPCARAMPAASTDSSVTWSTPPGRPASRRAEATRRATRSPPVPGFQVTELPATRACMACTPGTKSGKFAGPMTRMCPKGTRSTSACTPASHKGRPAEPSLRVASRREALRSRKRMASSKGSSSASRVSAAERTRAEEITAVNSSVCPAMRCRAARITARRSAGGRAAQRICASEETGSVAWP